MKLVSSSLIVEKYKIKDGKVEVYRPDIVEYQPYPPRKSHASAILNIASRDPDVRKRYGELLGDYEFIDREITLVLYIRWEISTNKEGFQQHIRKVSDEYDTLQYMKITMVNVKMILFVTGLSHVN